MRKLISIVLCLVFALPLSGCFAENAIQAVLTLGHDPLAELSGTLGIDLSDAVLLNEEDTHGGFHGDGQSCLALRLTATQGEAIALAVSEDPCWHPLPLSETAQALLYGISRDSSTIGPYLHDDSHKPLLPQIENGSYFFRDRHSQAADPADDASVLGRASLNFTIAVYDADTNTLYYLELDT